MMDHCGYQWIMMMPRTGDDHLGLILVFVDTGNHSTLPIIHVSFHLICSNPP